MNFFFYYQLTYYFSLSIQYRLAYTREEARCGVRLFYIWPLKYKEAIYEVHMVSAYYGLKVQASGVNL